MKQIIGIGLLSILMFTTVNVNAQLSLPKIFGNNMVLQRNQPVPIWGSAKAGDDITVTFNQQIKKTITDYQGNWKVLLDAMQASSLDSKLIIKTATESIELNNILVGEVWLCSGQSNMEYPMRKLIKTKMPEGITDWPINEVEQAHNKELRIFLVERKKMKSDPKHEGWGIAEDSALRSFSAVGYFFAKKLYEELHVPIGIVSAAIPGSRIEPWMPREAFTALPFFQQQTDSTHRIDGDPGKFYTTMIEPLIPFALKGFLWYQGESNCFLNERIQYAYKMEALINYWRTQWNNKQLPFYYVQIAPFEYSKQKGNGGYTEQSLPEFWEAQQLAMRLNNTAMIATIDLNSNLPDLHPVNKWDVGKRLAICALSKTYYMNSLVPMGPLYAGMTNHRGTISELSFDYRGTGLIGKGTGTASYEINGFEVAGVNGKYVPARAFIKGDRVFVAAADDKMKQIANVRYGWNESMHPNLYNKDGLPAMPFRTDNTLQAQFKPTTN
jgi:sialate O-acetylesterase